MIHCIFNNATDPAFNLALEEALLTKTKGSFFLLQRNTPCVILGKHQNIFREIDAKQMHKDGIPALRRISGGGTVYHDLGNLNFSFILPANPAFVASAALLVPILEALKNLGIKAHVLDETHLGVENRKISGNAQAMIKKRMLHHGTLLYQADLQRMGKYLQPSPGFFEDRAVDSKPRPVTNFSTKTSASMPELERALALDVLRWWKEEDARRGQGKDQGEDRGKHPKIDPRGNAQEVKQALWPGCLTLPREHHLWTRVLGQELWQETQRLAKEKYRSWEWNYGYPVTMVYTRSREILGQTVRLQARIEQGRFHEIRWFLGEECPGHQPGPKGLPQEKVERLAEPKPNHREKVERLAEPKPNHQEEVERLAEPGPDHREKVEAATLSAILERWTQLLEDQVWDYPTLLNRCQRELGGEELLQFLF